MVSTSHYFACCLADFLELWLEFSQYLDGNVQYVFTAKTMTNH